MGLRVMHALEDNGVYIDTTVNPYTPCLKIRATLFSTIIFMFDNHFFIIIFAPFEITNDLQNICIYNYAVTFATHYLVKI